MKAAVCHGSGEPLTVEEVPDPEPSADEVLIRVAACGVCHTDLHYVDHGTPTFKAPPMILGHEVSGVIEAAGAETEGFAPGDRVLAAAVLSCGTCEACRVGRDNIVSISPINYSHIDMATKALMSEYGVSIVYIG